MATYEGVVENGQIRLSEDIRLPEHARVYVVVPRIEETLSGYLASPRLAHPELIGDFAMEVEESPNAGV